MKIRGCVFSTNMVTLISTIPEMPRMAARDRQNAIARYFLASLPQDFIQWGQELQQVRPSEEGTYDLLFKNSTAGPFDLVVGADGAWSKARPLVSSYMPQYTGLTIIEFGIDDIDARYPSLSQLVGHGNLAAYGDDAKALIAQRNANAHVRVYAARMPEGWAPQHFNFSNPGQVREKFLSLYSDWASELKDLIRFSDDRIHSLPLYALPVGHRWPNRTGITLLGDAAHLMSPYGGSGSTMPCGTLPSWDACCLSQATGGRASGFMSWRCSNASLSPPGMLLTASLRPFPTCSSRSQSKR
jgi:2-polyprenyl-6-methoxyphenol hydroxylase-like FAD-dependent oxidoreductase